MAQQKPDTWFTSDWHLGHELMRKIRGFDTTREMDETIIQNFNACVKNSARTFHLGDFTYRGDPKRAAAVLSRLNGSHFLIIGNHDDAATIQMKWAGTPQYMMMIKEDDTKIFMQHLAARVWYGMHKGALHLYGHSHGRIPADSRSCDVGVDAWNLMPTNLQQIKARLALAAPHVEAEVEPDPENDGGLTP
jgi:calcineurin-like phosphoesterase family protein